MKITSNLCDPMSLQFIGKITSLNKEILINETLKYLPKTIYIITHSLDMDQH